MVAGTQGIARRTSLFAIGLAALGLAVPTQVLAANSASQITAKSRTALNQLYAANSKAAAVGKRAKGVLIFPHIVKAGFVIAGSSGDGVLMIHGKPVKYYNISSASFGLEAGAQGFSYALFFMDQKKLDEAQKNTRWDVGSDPNVVLIDQGGAKELDTRTLDKEVYAFAFGQKGLMGGISLKGSRTKEIHPNP